MHPHAPIPPFPGTPIAHPPGSVVTPGNVGVSGRLHASRSCSSLPTPGCPSPPLFQILRATSAAILASILVVPLLKASYFFCADCHFRAIKSTTLSPSRNVAASNGAMQTTINEIYDKTFAIGLFITETLPSAPTARPVLAHIAAHTPAAKHVLAHNASKDPATKPDFAHIAAHGGA